MSGRDIDRAIVDEVLTWTGTPYRHQASRKGVGCDCLGLVRGVWRAIHGEEPEQPGAYAADWAEAGNGDRLMEAARRHCVEVPASDLTSGRMVLFRWRPHLPAKHAGIMVAPNRFAHAYQGHAVIVSALVPQWRGKIAGVFAFPEGPSGFK